MYDGIIEDVEKVQKYLSKHGYKAVDESLIFELLEDCTRPDYVIVTLTGSSNHDSDFQNYHANDKVDIPKSCKDISCSSNSTRELIPVKKEFQVIIDLDGNTLNKQNVCELKNSTGKVAKNDDSSKVTAALGDNHTSKLDRSVLDLSSSKPIRNYVDLTDLAPKKCDAKSKEEEIDLTNSANESDIEVDNYYEDLCFDQESDSEQRICSPPLLSPSQLCGFTSSPNPDEQIQNIRMSDVMEILEENNNDPNNNLDDVENLVQNPMSITTSNVLSIDEMKVEFQNGFDSPKPGCSKDPHYIKLPYSDECEMSDEAVKIKTLLPGIEFDLILSTLQANQCNTNRVELTLWDLLPDKRPVAISCTKRKLNYDICSVSPKKSYAPSKVIDVPTKDIFSSKVSQELVNRSNQSISDIKTIDTEQNTTAKSTFFEQSSTASPSVSPINASKNPIASIFSNNFVPALGAVSSKNCDTNIFPNYTFNTLQEPVNYSDQSTSASKTIITKQSTVKSTYSEQPSTSSTSMLHINVSKHSAIPTSSKYIVTEPALIVESKNNDEKITETFGKEQTSHFVNWRLDQEMPTTSNCETVFSKHKTNEIFGNTSLPKCSLQEYTRPTNTIPRDIIKSSKLILQKCPINVPVIEHIPKRPLLAPAKLTLDHSKAISKVCQSVTASVSNLKNNNNSFIKDGTVDLNTSSQALPEHWRLLDLKCKSKDSFPLPATTLAEGNVSKIQEIFKLVNKPRTCSNNMALNKCKNIISKEVPIKDFIPSTSTGTIESNPRSKSEDNEFNSSVASPIILDNQMMVTKESTKEYIPNPKNYYMLRNMFPDVDPLYIKQVYLNGIEQKCKSEELIDKLLQYGEQHPRIVQMTPEPMEYNVDEQYENLLGIFPDADPNYLREFAEKYYDKPETITTFVQFNLEHRKYPTKEQYLKKIKITEQQRQYTTGFNVKQFLEIFPDPLAHFETDNRMSTYNAVAFEFLKSHFFRNKVFTISKEYLKCKYNLSMTAIKLTSIGPDMKSKRITSAMPTEDIPLLQEFAFIRNRNEILQYMSMSKEKEEREFKELKMKKLLLECQCCFDTECMPSKCSSCNEGHVFCNSCIITGTESRMGDGQTHFPCFVHCKGEFTLLILQKVLKPTTFSILLQKRQEAEVMAAGLEGLVTCPFCHFASIPPAEDKVFKCFNPECMKESCRLCKELNHVPFRCNEIAKTEEARHYLEEKMTQALVRTCYRCQRPFFKEEGCNKMTCPCGASMCYICGKPVTGYNHFNGQGSTRMDLCPLWSDNRRMNAETVLKVAEAAQKELSMKDPNIKINAQSIMPILPPKSNGPHQDIPNANVLPAHVYRAEGAGP